MFLFAYAAHAQENSDLNGTSCVPVKGVKEDHIIKK